MTESISFPELAMGNLKKQAQKWADQYPCIEQIVLYRTGYDFQENDDDHQPEYMIVVTVPPTPYSNEERDGHPSMAFKYKKAEGRVGIKDFSNHEHSFDGLAKGVKFECKAECKTIDGKLVSQAKRHIDFYADTAITEYPELESIIEYYDWVQADGMRGDCNHIWKYVPDFYNTRPKYSEVQHHWVWFSIPIEDDILEYNEDDDDFVKADQKEVLYEKQITPRERNKQKIQELGIRTWDTYPALLITHMKKLPEIQAIMQPNGKPYTDKTLHGYLSEKAPGGVKESKRPSKQNQEHQKEICNALNIPIFRKVEI